MVFSDPGEGSDGAIRLCQKIYEADPDALFLSRSVQQSGQLARAFRRHRRSRSSEQTEGAITHFVTSMGTSGTFMGNSRRFKRDMPDVQCISAQPSSGFHGLEGLKHMPTAHRAGHLRPDAGR